MNRFSLGVPAPNARDQGLQAALQHFCGGSLAQIAQNRSAINHFLD